MPLVLAKIPGDYEVEYMGREQLKCQNGSSLEFLNDLEDKMASLEVFFFCALGRCLGYTADYVL